MPQASYLLQSALYVLTLVGGLNSLVVAIRLSGDTDLVNSDALETLPLAVRLVMYYLYGVSSSLLVLAAPLGLWVKRGPTLLCCSLECA